VFVVQKLYCTVLYCIVVSYLIVSYRIVSYCNCSIVCCCEYKSQVCAAHALN